MPSTPRSVVLINGPNLNLLGTREPEKYGTTSLASVEEKCRTLCAQVGLGFDCLQSNHEGAIIDYIHTLRGQPSTLLIMNPGAFTHTSVAIRDAILAVQVPLVELHITNVHTREPFRHHSYFSDVAVGTIVGLGTFGYEVAIQFAAQYL